MNDKPLRINIFNALIIAFILFVGFVFIVAKFSVQIDWPRGLGAITKGIYLNRFFADFFLYAAIFILLYAKPIVLRVLAYLLAIAFTLVFLIQAQAFSITGSFLPSIALENAQHADFLDTDQHTYAAIVWCVLLLVVFRLIATCVRDIPNIKGRAVVAVVLLLASVLIKNDRSWLAEGTQQSRFEFYNSGRPGIPRASPVSELKKTYQDYQEYLEQENWVLKAAQNMSERGVRFAVKHNLRLSQFDEDYPLMSAGKELAPLPFLTQSNTNQPRNVIVFFAEGISARVVQPYSNKFPNLWPNIARFSEQATRIDNYFSHAYATYRGLSGQLCSIYAVGRLLPNTEYHCFGHALREHNYQTHFMVSQRLDNTNLDEVAIRAGFDSVDGAEVLAPLLSLPKGKDSYTISDKQLIKGLISRLKDHEADNQKPFAFGIYNFETHTGIKLFEDTTRYVQEGIANIDTLDTFHNFDQAFGEFWEYFKASPHYKDTVVVLTSDHATFPSREFNTIMSGTAGYTSLFVDTIPFMIYHPDGHASAPVDARNASSVNFLPSLLHLLNLKSNINAFIGKSVFLERHTFPEPAASGGTVLWVRNKLKGWKKIGEDNKDQLSDAYDASVGFYDYVSFTQSLERSNKLVRPR